jgi:hypothetical protein
MTNQNPNSSTSNSQRALIAEHLNRGNPLTAMQALNHFGCARLASRIDELRQPGMQIDTHWIVITNRNGKQVRVAEYRLAQVVAA